MHRFVYLRTGGRLGGRVLGLRFLLLEHTGRKSGRPFLAPLLYVLDGPRFAVVASNAGAAHNPSWWRNLQARPDAAVRVDRRRLAVRARSATPAEEPALWARLEAAWPSYARYRDRAGRRIPVVVLEPAPRLPG